MTRYGKLVTYPWTGKLHNWATCIMHRGQKTQPDMIPLSLKTKTIPFFRLENIWSPLEIDGRWFRRISIINGHQRDTRTSRSLAVTTDPKAAFYDSYPPRSCSVRKTLHWKVLEIPLYLIIVLLRSQKSNFPRRYEQVQMHCFREISNDHINMRRQSDWYSSDFKLIERLKNFPVVEKSLQCDQYSLRYSLRRENTHNWTTPPWLPFTLISLSQRRFFDCNTYIPTIPAQ